MEWYLTKAETVLRRFPGISVAREGFEPGFVIRLSVVFLRGDSVLQRTGRVSRIRQFYRVYRAYSAVYNIPCNQLAAAAQFGRVRRDVRSGGALRLVRLFDQAGRSSGDTVSPHDPIPRLALGKTCIHPLQSEGDLIALQGRSIILKQLNPQIDTIRGF
jgi:hypothetical protein